MGRGPPLITPRSKGQEPRPCGFNPRSEDNGATDDKDHLNVDRDYDDDKDEGPVYMAVTKVVIMMNAMSNSRPVKTASVYMAVTKVFIMMNAGSHNGLGVVSVYMAVTKFFISMNAGSDNGIRAAMVYMAVTKVFIMVNAGSDNGLGAVAD